MTSYCASIVLAGTSRSALLERVYEFREKIAVFSWKVETSKFSDPAWFSDLSVLVDITSCLSKLHLLLGPVN